MKLVFVSEKLIGTELANPIYTENGVMFLNKKGILTESAIKRLKRMGVTTVYVEDGGDEIDLQEVLETSMKLKVLKKIKEIFDEAKNKKWVNDSKVFDVVKSIMQNINLSENAILINNLVPNDEVSKLAVHSLDVTILSLMVGIRKKYNEQKLLKLCAAALLHDIGKLFTSGQEHVKTGSDLVKSNSAFTPMTYIGIYHLYEREDGRGLMRVEKDKIFEFSKIISICNEYINNVTREDGVLPHIAIEKIGAESVLRFDQEVYKDFVHSVYCYPNGLSVTLNNGLSGIVTMQNKNATTRPILVVKESNTYKFINLMEPQYLTLFIEKVEL